MELFQIESWQQFWRLVVGVWNAVFLGMSVGHVLAALLIMLVFLVLRSLLSRFLIGWLKQIGKRTSTGIDDKTIEALHRPMELVPVILGVFFAMQVLQLDPPFDLIATQIVQSLIVIAIFWAMFNIAAPVSSLLHRFDGVLTTAMVDWIVRAVRGLIIFIGGVSVLELWGIQVGPLLAGLGLFGVAVALGAQDLFKNLIAGTLILIERRFKQGDWIRVDGVVEGVVERIGFRSTRVRRFDKAPVIVPNAQLSDNAITNFSEMTHRRIYWVIGVEYSTTIEQLKDIRNGIDAYVAQNEDYAQPPEVPMFVRVDSFNSSSIDIMLYCFTKTTMWGEWLRIKEDLAYKIKEIVEGAGTGFAFPSQSIYIEQVPGERPEVFVPPAQ